MWVGEKYNEAANPENQKKPFWTKAILTTASLYFFTGCILPSTLPYYESPTHDKFPEFALKEENRIKVPFGYTSFLWDTEPGSKRAVERTGNLVFYKGEQRGQLKKTIIWFSNYSQNAMMLAILLRWSTPRVSCRMSGSWPRKPGGTSPRQSRLVGALGLLAGWLIPGFDLNICLERWYIFIQISGS